MDDLTLFLQASVPEKEAYKPRPWLELADGMTISVQCGEYLYCSPREHLADANYKEVEIMTSSSFARKHMVDHSEDPEAAGGDIVYAYVPIELVKALIAFHGGIARVKRKA